MRLAAPRRKKIAGTAEVGVRMSRPVRFSVPPAKKREEWVDALA